MTISQSSIQAKIKESTSFEELDIILDVIASEVKMQPQRKKLIDLVKERMEELKNEL